MKSVYALLAIVLMIAAVLAFLFSATAFHEIFAAILLLTAVVIFSALAILDRLDLLVKGRESDQSGPAIAIESAEMSDDKQTPMWVYITISLVIVGAVVLFVAQR